MTKKDIFKIYSEFCVPEHIIAHMEKVAYVCEFLASGLMKKGFKIDIDSLQNAALLHDVLRLVDCHEKEMARVMRQKGEYKIAKLIAGHGFFSIWKLKTWEEKILYYADKRVDHDKVVDLKKRFEEGRKRNFTPKDDMELVLKTEKEIEKLEKEFVKILGKSVYSL